MKKNREEKEGERKANTTRGPKTPLPHACRCPQICLSLSLLPSRGLPVHGAEFGGCLRWICGDYQNNVKFRIEYLFPLSLCVPALGARVSPTVSLPSSLSASLPFSLSLFSDNLRELQCIFFSQSDFLAEVECSCTYL